MNVEHLIAFNAVLIAAILSPGPALLVAMRTTLAAGRRAGIAVGLGLGLVASLWTGMALFGLDVVFDMFPWAYGAARLAGACYLIYLAVRMWRGAKVPVRSDVTPAAHAFRQGVFINLMNPKSVLFAAAVLIVVFPANMKVAERLFVMVNHFGVEAVFYSCLAFAMSNSRVSAAYLRAKVWFDRFAAVLLGALGLKLLLGR